MANVVITNEERALIEAFLKWRRLSPTRLHPFYESCSHKLTEREHAWNELANASEDLFLSLRNSTDWAVLFNKDTGAHQEHHDGNRLPTFAYAVKANKLTYDEAIQIRDLLNKSRHHQAQQI